MQTTAYRSTALFFVVILLVGLVGCAGNRKNIQPEIQPMHAPELTVRHSLPSPAENDGSLWQVRSF